ncbi:KN motif and ankyrin repeat domain-containing protein 2 [Rhinoraja longicauda]
MADVLPMKTNFSGGADLTTGTEARGSEGNLPYSVETPYGFHLDLDFVKYVDDIEKGNTIKKVHIHRRPRGCSYTGSWWTSTESLCSNASGDSRHSSYSTCSRGNYTPGCGYGYGRGPPGPPGAHNSRVEKTLLETRRRLEEEPMGGGEGKRSRYSSIGSLHGGSTSSLSGLGQPWARLPSHNGPQGGTFTPLSSGLATPSTPSPGHLHNIREQMAAALRRLRELEDQVKMVPVLQVKISVLQEEKRQLSVQLKSQKFLGHPASWGAQRASQPRGELFIDIPEEEDHGVGQSDRGSPLSPALRKLTQADQGGPANRRPPTLRSVGIWVREADLGITPSSLQREADHHRHLSQLLARKISGLERRLREAGLELEARKEAEDKGCQAEVPCSARALEGVAAGRRGGQGGRVGAPPPLPPPRDPTPGPREGGDGGAAPEVGTFKEVPAKLVSCTIVTTLASTCEELPPLMTSASTVRPQRPGPSPALLRQAVRQLTCDTASRGDHEAGAPVRPPGIPEVPRPVSETVHELGTSMPGPALHQRPEEGSRHLVRLREPDPSSDDSTRPVSPHGAQLKSIMKKKENGAVPDSPPTKKSLQFIGVNGGYESTSSEESATESGPSESEGESTESDYHEASERLPGEQAERAGSVAPGAGPAPETKSPPPVPAEPHREAGSPPETETESTRESAERSGSKSEGEKQVRNVTGEERVREVVPGQETEARVTSGPEQPETTPQPEIPSPQQETDSITFALTEGLISACVTLQKHLSDPEGFTNKDVRVSYLTVQQEWLLVSSPKAADVETVRRYLAVFKAMSPGLLELIVNMADGNGNTTLHYTVSHSNFPIVKLLLDTGACNLDKQNKAGYTSIMLASLAALQSNSDMQTVMQLFRQGNVNAKASQAGQTALMLAVSHGRTEMVKVLLACGADACVQDDDGSTALMCACEHGHAEIVALLLATPTCNVTLADNDGSTALSIAVESGQKDIAALLHKHLSQTAAAGPSTGTTAPAQPAAHPCPPEAQV